MRIPQIVVHAAWLPGREIFLWAEDGRRLQRTRRGHVAPRGRQGASSPLLHPFLADRNRLKSRVRNLLPAHPEPPLLKREVRIHLPRANGLPLPSPGLRTALGPGLADGRGEPDEEGRLLECWRVRGYVLGEGLLLDLLADMGRRGRFLSASGRPWSEYPGHEYGETLLYLRMIARQAVDLIRSGRIRPDLRQDTDGGWRACWEPAPAQGEGELPGRLEALHRAAPDCLLAAQPLFAEAGSQPPRREALAGLLAHLVDQAVSYALEGRAARESAGNSLFPWAFLGREEEPLMVAEDLPLPDSPPAATWLRGLVGDSLFEEDDRALERAAQALGPWLERARDPRCAGLRLALRVLTPRENDADAWEVHPRVDLMPLDGTDEGEGGDRSEVVEATLPVPGMRAGMRRGEELASRAWWFMHDELQARAERFPGLLPLPLVTEDHLELDAEEAHRLLAEGAPELAARGVKLEVPEWWVRRRVEVSVRLEADPLASLREPELGLDQLCRVDWRVVLGDQELSDEELQRLSREARALVRVAGRWVELTEKDRERLRQAAEERARAAEEDDGAVAPLVQALRLGAGLEEAPGGLPISGVRGGGWLAGLLGGDGAAPVAELPREVRTPRTFRGKLRHYQRRGVAWLEHLEAHGLGGCLADDMGLGKTVQLLALLVRERPAARRSTLLVAPLSVLSNWIHETRRFTPRLRVGLYHGPDRLEGEALGRWVRDLDLVVTSYGVLTRSREELAALSWHRVVLDEAQNIKNPETATARAARALDARHRHALTGTPVENRLGELWSLMHFLNPGLLGSRRRFRDQFARAVERDGDPTRTAALRQLIAPFLLRRRKSDPGIAPELPEKLEERHYCHLTREQAALYRSVTDEALEAVAAAVGMRRRGLVLRTLLRLKQVCNHPEHLLRTGGKLAGRSGKLSRLEELVHWTEETGTRLLCFTQYREMGELIGRRLEEHFGWRPPFLHGGVARRAREEMVARFQAGEGPPLFLISLKAGGTGLNLTAASTVVHFDRWWNPAVEDQATDRAHRIGQHRDVVVHRLVCAGTLEERIDRILEEKRELAERVVSGAEGWITELDTEALRELLTLDDDAVVEGEEVRPAQARR